MHLAKGEQYQPEFTAINPQNLVPVLEDDGHLLYQSLAIMQYLDETHPEPPLLPTDPLERNRVRSLALIIACEIHPLNNPRVLNYLTGKFGISEEQKLEWYHHWVKTGFAALEKRLAGEPDTGRFCHGDTPGFRRLRAGAAGRQRQALQGRPRRLPDHPSHQRRVPEARGVPEGGSGASAGCGAWTSGMGSSFASRRVASGRRCSAPFEVDATRCRSAARTARTPASRSSRRASWWLCRKRELRCRDWRTHHSNSSSATLTSSQRHAG